MLLQMVWAWHSLVCAQIVVAERVTRLMYFRLLLQVVFEAAAPVGDQQPMEKQQLFPHLVSLD
jgi:hypothetical protein